MKIKVINIDNKPGKEIELSDFVFGIEPRSDIMARVVRWQLAKRRLGNHSVKTRADIKMTTAKMYKQKGTGNARHGSAAVSQFRGGGSAHGPVVHSHSHSLNKKVRLLGLRSASLKKKLDAMGFKNLLVITGDSVDLNFQRAANNIIHVDLLSHAGLNVYDIVRKENLIITDDAVKLLEGRFV